MMKKLVLLASLVVLLAPGAVLAEKEGASKEQPSVPDANFAKAKAKRVENLKSLLACVEAAQSREAIKSCREQINKKHEMHKIQEQKKRLEERERKVQGDAVK
ncbi:MAG: hypothetical protein H7837_02525 [Magnetococcus sp. MYC-9]